MEMHQIRYFLAVARVLNFTRAAEECHVAQPSLSRAVKRLEEELGGDLFRRERGQTHLTDLGRTMEPLLRRSYESALAAKEQASNYRKSKYAPLRIGLSLSVALEVVAPSLSELARAFPGLELHLVRGSAEGVLATLKAGEVELAVAAEVALDWDRFDCWSLFEENFAIIVARDHGMAGRKAVSLAEFAGETVIMRPYCESTPALEGMLASRDIALRRPHEAANDADVATLVERGFGLALLPRSGCRAVTASQVQVSDLDLSRKVQAYGVAGRQRSVAAAGLVRLLRAADWSVVAA